MGVISEKYQRVTIVARKDYAEGLWSIRVRPDAALTFTPGQYATLGIEAENHTLERPYSIVSSPAEEEIEFFLELVPHGGLSPVLHGMTLGDSLLMRRQAKGRFTLDGESSGHRRHLLVCTVTGVAPYVSIVRTLARQEKEGALTPGLRVVVLQAASRSWEFGYREELENLARTTKWLTYIPTISRPWEDPAWRGEVGRVEDTLRKYLDSLELHPADTTVYLCGHPQMILNAKGILERKGFTREFIREELYWPPKKGER